jgi:DNA-binding MarR family transcriptional regulator
MPLVVVVMVVSFALAENRLCAHARIVNDACVRTQLSGTVVFMTTKDERVDAWRQVLLAQARALTEIEADLAARGQIPLSHYDVLLELDAAPDHRLRMAELADKAVLSRTRISRLVDELEKAGYVTREPCTDDGRVTWATITTSGRRALRRAAPVYLDSIERNFTALLDDDERRTVARALRKVVDHHDERRREKPRRRG